MGSGLVAAAGRARPSRSDRERVADVLRRACADERLSSETFIGRLDLVYAAGTRFELDRLVADLPEPARSRRLVLDFVTWWSGATADISRAWHRPRLARLILPKQAEVTIGRSPHSDFVVADRTVSSLHAVLSHDGDGWLLRDVRSTNGTYLNGWRITDPVAVRPGDELTLGETTFVLALHPA